jgi:hypothetical protein
MINLQQQETDSQDLFILIQALVTGIFISVLIKKTQEISIFKSLV